MLFKFFLICVSTTFLHQKYGLLSISPYYMELEMELFCIFILTQLMGWGGHCCVTRNTTVDEKLCILHNKFYIIYIPIILHPDRDIY